MNIFLVSFVVLLFLHAPVAKETPELTALTESSAKVRELEIKMQMLDGELNYASKKLSRVERGIIITKNIIASLSGYTEPSSLNYANTRKRDLRTIRWKLLTLKILQPDIISKIKKQMDVLLDKSKSAMTEEYEARKRLSNKYEAVFRQLAPQVATAAASTDLKEESTAVIRSQ